MAEINDPTTEVTHGKVTKYWWILMIFPVGLIIGTVTSTRNHIYKDKQQDDITQYLVSEAIDTRPLRDDFIKLIHSSRKSPKATLRSISSSNGIHHYLKLGKLEPNKELFGYYDINAKRKADRNNILAVVINIDEQDKVSRASMIALSIAVMKSVFGETEFQHTLRFVFAPITQVNSSLIPAFFRFNKEHIIDYYIVQPLDPTAFEQTEWLQHEQIISHPALNRNTHTALPEDQIRLVFQAAQQLRELLLSKL